MSEMFIFKVMSIFVFISLMVCQIEPQELDCSETYRSWNMTLEFYLAHCNESFCGCLENNCPKEWSRDKYEAIVKYWLMQSADYYMSTTCRSKIPKVVPKNLLIKTDIEKQFFWVSPSIDNEYDLWYWYIDQNRGKRVSFSVSDRSAGRPLTQFELTNQYLGIRLNTLGMFQIRIQSEFFSFSGDIRKTIYGNKYPFGVRVSAKSDPLFDTQIAGMFGGHKGPAFSAWLQWMMDQDKEQTIPLHFHPITIEDNYEIRSNPRVALIKVRVIYSICMGRTRDGNGRTRWTGETCRPVIYYLKRKNPDQLYVNYDLYCECDFPTIGLNAIDDSAAPELVEGFNTLPECTTREASGYVIRGVIVSSILLGICLILILTTIGFYIYVKLHKSK